MSIGYLEKSQVQDALDVKFDSALPADTYLQKKKQLIQVFDSPHKRLQARIMIKNLTLNPNESPNDFYRRLLIAAKRLDNLSEHEIQSIWFHGVSIQYGSDMIRMGATKFEEQLQITQNIWLANNMRFQSKDCMPYREPFSDYADKRYPSISQNNHLVTTPGHTSPLLYDSHKKQDTDKQLDNRLDHLVDMMGKLTLLLEKGIIPEKPEKSVRKCYICQELGHISRYCPKQRKEENFQKSTNFVEIDSYPVEKRKFNGENHNPSRRYLRTHEKEKKLVENSIGINHLANNTGLTSTEPVKTPYIPAPKAVIIKKSSQFERPRNLKLTVKDNSYDLVSNLQESNAGISFAQLLKYSPTLRANLRSSLKNTEEKELKLQVETHIVESLNDTTAMYAPLTIEGYTYQGIIDSGAASTILPIGVLKTIGRNITRSTNSVLRTANGCRKPIGETTNVDIAIADKHIPLTVLIVDNLEYPIIGNDWLTMSKAEVSWKNITLYSGLRDICEDVLSPLEALCFNQRRTRKRRR